MSRGCVIFTENWGMLATRRSTNYSSDIYHWVAIIGVDLQDFFENRTASTENISVSLYLLLIISDQSYICKGIIGTHLLQNIPQMIWVGVPVHSGRVPYCCLDGAIFTDLYKYF